MVKFAIIGWSDEAEAIYHIIQNYISDVELVGISSSDDAIVQRFRRSSTIKLAEHDYRRVLSFHDLDIVYVAAGYDTSTQMAIDAMEAGAHVLLAHPITTNVGEAFTIKSKVDHYTTQYGMVVLPARHDATFTKVKQMLSKGICGKIRSVHIDAVIPYQQPISGASLPITAGLYMDHLTYDIDLVHYLCDDHFADVHARGRVMCYDHLHKQKDIDTAMISGRLTSNTMVQISAIVSDIPAPRTSIQIVGTQAVVSCTNAAWDPTIKISDQHATQIVRTHHSMDPLQKVLLDFRDHALHKRLPSDTLLYSIDAIKVAVAMSKSDILREEVALD